MKQTIQTYNYLVYGLTAFVKDKGDHMYITGYVR